MTALNNHYGAGTYVASTYQATTSGGGDGDGPNALVYNSTTVTLVSTEGVGNPSDAGYPRQPVRYEFRPVGGSSRGRLFCLREPLQVGDVATDNAADDKPKQWRLRG